MKNSELWKSYESYTIILTEVARKLGFGAAAIIWFFKTPNNTFPSYILVGFIFLILYFMCDILQFMLGAVILRIWTRREEIKKWNKEETIEGDYNKPAWLDYPSFTMWCAKVVFLFISFLLIGLHLIYG